MKPDNIIVETLAMYLLYIALAVGAVSYVAPKAIEVLQTHLVNAASVK